MSWKAIDRNSQDYIELKKAGVKFYKTPDADPARAARGLGQDDRQEGRARTRCSRRCSTRRRPSPQRAGQWQNDYMVDFKMAYNHYFAQGEEGLTTARHARSSHPVPAGWLLFAAALRGPR